MVHTQRYYKLKRLQNLYEDLSRIVEQMAFNEDLPEFDSEFENLLKNSYWQIINSISEMRNNLGL